MKTKTRQANMELLRIIAMMMVVILHYLIKGEAAVSLADDFCALNILLWFVKAMCIVATNVYVLISGYFLLEAEWKISRLVNLWLQIMFYSLGVPAVCYALNIGEVRQWGRYDWINVIFPLQMEHYWFMTAYVVLYILVPVLSAGVKHMEKRQHQLVIAGGIFIFSIPKSILPVSIPTDSYGYDFGWFICLFLIASYIRIYGIRFLEVSKRAVVSYFVLTAGVWIAAVIYGGLSRRGMSFSYAMDMTYCYNYIVVLLASVALFYTFLKCKIPQGRSSKIICKIASYTLGVYLLHENLAVRNQWIYWAGIEKVRGKGIVVPHMLLTALAIFAAGIGVDFVRDCIFQWFYGNWKKRFAVIDAKEKRK